MSKSKKILIAIIAILVVIQFIPHEMSTAEVNPVEEFSSDNEELTNILQTACYDCHSNETTYPWYASIAPVNYWLDGHVEHGREHLNFSEWNTYPIADQRHAAKEIVEVVEKKEMPMLFYWLIHWDAKLTDAERKVIVDHFNELK